MAFNLSTQLDNPYAAKQIGTLLQQDRIAVSDMLKIIGEKRYFRLTRHRDLEVKSRAGYLSNSDAKKMIFGMGLVYAIDVNELLQELHDTSKHPVRHLTPDQTTALFDLLEGNFSFDALDPKIIDELMKVLVPVSDLSSLFFWDKDFLNHAETKNTCGKGFLGLQATVWELQRLRLLRLSTADPALREEFTYQIYGKRLVDLEPEAGLMIAHPQGWYQSFEAIHGTYPVNRGVNIFSGGHYIIPLSAKTPGLMSAFLFRGTRVKVRATDPLATCVENLRANQGAQVKHAIEPIREYLEKPTRGFVQDSNETIRLIGMSLGAAHAARMAIAFSDRVHECVLLSPVGLDQPSLNAYADRVKSLSFKPRIRFILNPEDNVFYFGSGHLGFGINADHINVEMTWLNQTNSRIPSDITLDNYRQFFSPSRLKVSKLHSNIEYENDYQRWHMTLQSHPTLLPALLNNTQDQRKNSEIKRRKMGSVLPGLSNEYEFVQALTPAKQFNPTSAPDTLKNHRFFPTKTSIFPRRFGLLVKQHAELQTPQNLKRWLEHYQTYLSRRWIRGDKADLLKKVLSDHSLDEKNLLTLLQTSRNIHGKLQSIIEIIATPRIGSWNEKQFAHGFDQLIKDFPVLKPYDINYVNM